MKAHFALGATFVLCSSDNSLAVLAALLLSVSATALKWKPLKARSAHSFIIGKPAIKTAWCFALWSRLSETFFKSSTFTIKLFFSSHPSHTLHRDTRWGKLQEIFNLEKVTLNHRIMHRTFDFKNQVEPTRSCIKSPCTASRKDVVQDCEAALLPGHYSNVRKIEMKRNENRLGQREFQSTFSIYFKGRSNLINNKELFLARIVEGL